MVLTRFQSLTLLVHLFVNVLLFCDATSTIASLCGSMGFGSIEADLAYLNASDSVDFSQWGAPIQSMAL